jgi:uncharacterized YigZ family protein
VKNGTYRTLTGLSSSISKEKGSKFIGLAIPVFSEEEAKTYLDAWRKEYSQAQHLCYAYRIGVDNSRIRYSDDGEPTNSAGTPILGQIQSFDLSNILIGVVRYFGGTKLGVGGLVQAYKGAAREAIEQGEIIESEVCEFLELNFEYAAMPSVMRVLKKHHIQLLESDFNLSCSVHVKIPVNRIPLVANELTRVQSVKVISPITNK